VDADGAGDAAAGGVDVAGAAAGAYAVGVGDMVAGGAYAEADAEAGGA
jgi:hypothetical protein